MALICIVTALVLERVIDTLEDLRNYHWFERYCQWMINHLPGLNKQGASSIIILLLPVVIFVAIIQNGLDEKFFDFFSL